MRKLAAVAAVLAVVSISACKKTGEGEYQVEKPVVGTQTDTIHTPTVDVGTQTTTVAVPKVVSGFREDQDTDGNGKEAVAPYLSGREHRRSRTKGPVRNGGAFLN